MGRMVNNLTSRTLPLFPKGVHSPANGNRTMLFERGGCITQYAMVK